VTAPVASGWSGCRVGLAPTGKRRLFTAHTRCGPSDRQEAVAQSGRKNTRSTLRFRDGANDHDWDDIAQYGGLLQDTSSPILDACRAPVSFADTHGAPPHRLSVVDRLVSPRRRSETGLDARGIARSGARPRKALPKMSRTRPMAWSRWRTRSPSFP